MRFRHLALVLAACAGMQPCNAAFGSQRIHPVGFAPSVPSSCAGFPPARLLASLRDGRPPVQIELEERLRYRRAGLSCGIICIGLGVSTAISDGMLALPPALMGSLLAASLVVLCAWLAVSLTYEEPMPPISAAMLEVRPSPGKGHGLYAAAPIAAGTFLFDYEGEVFRKYRLETS